MKTGNLELKVINGNLNGLGLVLQADRMFSSLTQGRDYPLITQFNGQDYEFTGTVCHMQYNWQTLIHRIGVTLHPMDKEHETVLSKLIDPNFTIALKHGEVDTTAGKIST